MLWGWQSHPLSVSACIKNRVHVFQAVGHGREPLLLSVLHKGSLDILLMIFISNLGNTENIVWAAPISEAAALVLAIILFGHFYRQIMRR